jgi:aryl-alcohol dehydrogenase-like predicted oxidoreductase
MIQNIIFCSKSIYEIGEGPSNQGLSRKSILKEVDDS